MKQIAKPRLKSARILTPAEMNGIHFGGIHTPLDSERLKAIAAASGDPDLREEK